MSEWQPIETAPAGTELLLLAEKLIGSDSYPIDFMAVGMLDTWCTRGWVDHDGELLSFKPTHWMPLPRSPKTEGAE